MKQDEKILVVEREKLLGARVMHGLFPACSFDDYLTIIDEHKKFLWRSAMEQDPCYKQIIPYMIFTYQDKIFLMRRKSDATAKELRNKYTFGIGGHLREEDLAGSTIAEWGKREFEEEVNYEGELLIKPLGLLNDENSFIGHVHAGFAFLFEGSTDNISIKSELKEGFLLTLDECLPYYNDMELWSQFVFDYLFAQRSTRK